MISNQKTERAMVFIDLRNVINAQLDTTGTYAELDFVTMVHKLAGSRNIVGAYVFDGVG